jgi:predicted acylesterase/phospholipase RssA
LRGPRLKRARTATKARRHPRKVALVFSGGVVFGAYQAGAYAALHTFPALWPGHIAGSSVGAVERSDHCEHATRPARARVANVLA